LIRAKKPFNTIFRRTPESADLVYAFDAKSIYLTVAPANRVTMISAFHPLSVELDGVQLLGRKIADVEEALSRSPHRFRSLCFAL
jgi:hypothetical protein